VCEWAPCVQVCGVRAACARVEEEEEVKDEEKITKGDFLNQGKGPEDPTEEIRKKCLAQSSKLPR